MRKGFTLIELLAVIVILAVIALIATPIILGIVDSAKKSAFQDTAYGIVEAARNEYVKTLYKNETPVDITYTYTNGVETSSIAGKSLSYSGAKPQNGFVSLNTEGKVSLKLHDGKYCVIKDFNDTKVTIEEKTLEDCMPPMVDQSGANVPVLTTGMTPIIWDETTSTWITASNIDDPYKQNWYDYQNKKWANAKTADGSMWVWIPRYAYSISSGYHTSTTGTINVKFLHGTTNTAGDATTVDTTPIYSDADTQSNYIVHPAFKFGNTELTGIWVAKFEMSVANQSDACYTSSSAANCDKTTLVPKIIPNANSWRNIAVGNMFTVARNMETNSIYGWTTASTLKSDGTFTIDNNGLDTHLMKNIEWGAIAYLTQSTYGKNSQTYINNSSTYTTGCSGGSTNATSYSGCQYAYNTIDTGTGASTTGTIYGIYDLSGGAFELLSAYIDNGSSSTYGLSIVNAVSKYKDVYQKGTTDSQTNNYALTENKKGDAIWETSNNINGSYSWFSDYSYIPASDTPWFFRGGRYLSGSHSSMFNFYYAFGNVNDGYCGFRSVLAIASGL